MTQIRFDGRNLAVSSQSPSGLPCTGKSLALEGIAQLHAPAQTLRQRINTEVAPLRYPQYCLAQAVVVIRVVKASNIGQEIAGGIICAATRHPCHHGRGIHNAETV